jgi:hypothetical protein
MQKPASAGFFVAAIPVGNARKADDRYRANRYRICLDASGRSGDAGFDNSFTHPHPIMYPTLTMLQSLLSWASSLSLIAMLFVTWRRLKILGFLVVAIGGVLNFVPRIVQAVTPPMRMDRMPLSGALTLGDESRAVEFMLIHSCYLAAGVLIVIGSLMVLVAWSNKNVVGISP